MRVCLKRECLPTECTICINGRCPALNNKRYETDWTIPRNRYEAWKQYKELVDREVTRLEQLHNQAMKDNAPNKEEVRFFLNEMYHTQYELDKNMI